MKRCLFNSFLVKVIVVFHILFGYSLASFSNSYHNDQALRIPLQSSQITLDPGGIQDASSLFISRQINCQLVRNHGYHFVLEAAESIKYITPYQIILKISGNARFSDGSPVTSDDVITSFNYIKKSRNIFNNTFTWIDKIETIDQKSIKFTLKKKIPQFLKVLSSHDYSIFKKEFIERAINDKKLWNKPLSCGKYKITEFNNEKIELVPVYNGLSIIFDINNDNQIYSNDIGKYDIISLNVIGKSKELDDFKVIRIYDPVQFFIGLNSKSKMWKNTHERCVFLSSINVDKLLASYGEEAIKANDLIPKGTLGYDANGEFNNYALKFAKTKQVAKKNDSESQPFCLAYLTVSVQEKNKNEYLNMIKELYPSAFMKPIADVKKFGKKFVNENCDALIFGWWSSYLDAYEYLTIFEDGDANFSGIYNKELDKQISRSQEILSAHDRSKEYRNIIKKIGNQCVVRPLLTKSEQIIYTRFRSFYESQSTLMV